MKMNTIKKKIFNKTDVASKKTHNSPSAHTDEILCLALSDDFKYLVSLNDARLASWVRHLGSKPETI